MDVGDQPGQDVRVSPRWYAVAEVDHVARGRPAAADDVLDVRGQLVPGSAQQCRVDVALQRSAAAEPHVRVVQGRVRIDAHDVRPCVPHRDQEIRRARPEMDARQTEVAHTYEDGGSPGHDA